jgi:hypothetical protein
MMIDFIASGIAGRRDDHSCHNLSPSEYLIRVTSVSRHLDGWSASGPDFPICFDMDRTGGPFIYLCSKPLSDSELLKQNRVD